MSAVAKPIPRVLRKTYSGNFEPYAHLDKTKSHWTGSMPDMLTRGFWMKPRHYQNNRLDRVETNVEKDLFTSRYHAHVNHRAIAVERAIKAFEPEMANVPAGTIQKIANAKKAVTHTYPDDLRFATEHKALGWTYMDRKNHFNGHYEMLNLESTFGRLNVMNIIFLLVIWSWFNAKFQPIAKAKGAVACVSDVLTGK